MSERLLSFLDRGKTVVGNDGVIRQIGASRKDAGGAERKTAGMHAHGTVLTVEWGLLTGGE